MNIFVAFYEGGLWHQTTTEECNKVIGNIKGVNAVRCGDWIYDFTLKRMGLNPIRLYNYKHGD